MVDEAIGVNRTRVFGKDYFKSIASFGLASQAQKLLEEIVSAWSHIIFIVLR